MTRSHPSAAAGLLFLLVLPGAATPSQAGVVWEDSVAVDTGIAALSNSSGVSAQWFGDRLWIFYERNGDVYGAAHGAAGWEAPRRLTIDSGRQSDPHVCGNQVIWEDWRGPVPEIWKARFDGTTWSDESILSPNDGVPSRHGAIAGGYPGWLMAAWEDSLPGGFRVQVRRYDGTAWLAPELVTLDTSGQRSPSVGGAWELVVAWADSRHGEPEIYERSFTYGTWSTERRVTDLPGACRHPSLVVERSGDIYDEPLLAFEYTEPSGVIETYARSHSGPERISPDDGIPSVEPNSASFAIDAYPCGQMEGAGPEHYVTWTDLVPHRSHQVWSYAGIDPSPVGGIGTSILAARDGYPQADIFEAWIESRGGVPTLVARFGHTAGCWQAEIVAPPSLLVAPEGIPAVSIRTVNECGGDPLPHVSLFGTLDASLIQDLTWDPAHPPQELFDLTTDDSGEVTLPLYGGGCTQNGLASVECLLHDRHEFQGARSPDVNGDCIVGPDDLEYVRSRLGTTDFCADLDMSGTVGQEDVALVEATLWDRCSNITAVPGIDASRKVVLVASPNPAREFVRFRLLGWSAGASQISIHDASGRLVRILAARAGAPTVSWDLRDASGLALNDGMYFAAARIEGRRVTTPVLVVR